MNDDLRHAAIWYGWLGWRVVPLHPRLKVPIHAEWQRKAASDRGQIERWWDETPDANVGVALGPGSGIVGIDIDSDEGWGLLDQMAGDTMDICPEMTTGKGARLLYAIPPGLEPRTRSIKGQDDREALRFQGVGGQCVMPPSIHPGDPERDIPPGRVYAWSPDRSPRIPIPPMPAWLIAEMCRPDQPAWDPPQDNGDSNHPGADLNRRGDFAEFLLAAGFRPAGGRGRVRYFTRPGKASGVSVSLGHYQARDGTPALYVFSGSIPGLTAGKAYDLFGAYTHLRHAGDFPAAARHLAADGYGTQRAAGGKWPEKVERVLTGMAVKIATLEARLAQLESKGCAL